MLQSPTACFFFFFLRCIYQSVILQSHTKEFDYTTVYGQYILKMHFSATMLFETLQNWYMLLRLIVACSSIQNMSCDIYSSFIGQYKKWGFWVHRQIVFRNYEANLIPSNNFSSLTLPMNFKEIKNGTNEISVWHL